MLLFRTMLQGSGKSILSHLRAFVTQVSSLEWYTFEEYIDELTLVLHMLKKPRTRMQDKRIGRCVFINVEAFENISLNLTE